MSKKNENAQPKSVEQEELELLGIDDSFEDETPDNMEDPGFPTVGVNPNDIPDSIVERERAKTEHLAVRHLRQEEAACIGKYLNAHKNNYVLDCKIATVQTHNGFAYWVCYDGPVTVFIPFVDAFVDPPKDLVERNSKTTLTRQMQLLGNSIGAKIAFTVERMEGSEDGKVYFAWGSRKNALEKIHKRYFGQRAVKPLSVGDDVVAQFISVGQYAAYVNVGGIDVRLNNAQLSHRYLADLTKHFVPGDEINVRIQNIAFKDGEVNLTVSALPCELEVCRQNLHRVKRGTRCHAVITTVRIMTTDKGPKFVAAMFLEDLELPAFASVLQKRSREGLHTGDRVLVETMGVTKRGYVHCAICHYL